jgi:hypothetical protein
MIAKVYYVACDGCGRRLGSPAGSAAGARSLARSLQPLDRWGRVRRRLSAHPRGPHRGADYCPACVVAWPEVRKAIRDDIDEERAKLRGDGDA